MRRSPLARTLRPLLAAAATAAACSPAAADEAARIAGLLALRAGTVVADVGAGEGEWTVGLAVAVGDSGRVYATEVTDEELRALRDTVDRSGVRNVTVVRGDQHRTGLPRACCDAILLRMVYHHFTDPSAMRSDLAGALRPGGRALVIDIDPQPHWRDLEGVPERGGHGIPIDELIDEMAADGFEAVERAREWNGDPERYAVLFRRVGE